MLLAMFVAGTTDLYSQRMNKRTEETPQSVIANVHKAARLLKEKGSEALAVLTDPKSEFNDRDAYLFIIDVDKSLVVSNPRFPERTGGNIREHLDWSGKHYGVELCEVAMRGGGWIEFVWPKPGTEKGVRKVSYIYPIPGMRYTVCAGVRNHVQEGGLHPVGGTENRIGRVRHPCTQDDERCRSLRQVVGTGRYRRMDGGDADAPFAATPRRVEFRRFSGAARFADAVSSPQNYPPPVREIPPPLCSLRQCCLYLSMGGVGRCGGGFERLCTEREKRWTKKKE